MSSTHCRRGHPWSENAYVVPATGKVECKGCRTLAMQAWRAKNKPVAEKDVLPEDKKKCGHCKQIKEKSNFWRNRSMSDGLDRTCMDCRRKTLAARRALALHKEKRQLDPYKAKARVLVHSLVNKGLLDKQPCFLCGINTDVHGHHLNYDFPDKVVWLCRPHHLGVHNG